MSCRGIGLAITSESDPHRTLQAISFARIHRCWHEARHLGMERWPLPGESVKVPRRPERQLSDLESSAAQIDLCRQGMTAHLAALIPRAHQFTAITAQWTFDSLSPHDYSPPCDQLRCDHCRRALRGGFASNASRAPGPARVGTRPGIFSQRHRLDPFHVATYHGGARAVGLAGLLWRPQAARPLIPLTSTSARCICAAGRNRSKERRQCFAHAVPSSTSCW